MLYALFLSPSLSFIPHYSINLITDGVIEPERKLCFTKSRFIDKLKAILFDRKVKIILLYPSPKR